MIRVNLPRRLDQSLAEVDRLRPTSLTVTVSLREASTATMTLPTEDVQMHDMIELFSVRGSLGLYRVSDIEASPRKDCSVTLRHAIDTLSDDVWAAQLDYDGTVAGFLADLLDQQTVVRWQLGTCADTADWKKSGINYSRLSELLWELADDRRDYGFMFDFSNTPWTLNFVELPTAVGAEVRLSRNVESLQIRRSDADMANKLYMSVTDGTNVTIQTYENQQSQTLYGLIAKTADINVDDVPDPAAWAADFLARRASPGVQVTINGYELSRLTGETFDEMAVGKKCRVALPGIPETLTETIVAVTYPDIYATPERVTVELNNHLEKFSETIASLKKRAGGGGGGGGGGGRLASAAELKRWAQVVSALDAITKTSELKKLVETGIVLVPGGATIYSLIEGIESNRGQIDVNANQISLVVDGNGVKAASIVAAINKGSSSIKLTADHITLDGDAVATSLSGKDINAKDLSANLLTVSNGLTLSTGQTGGFWVNGNSIGYHALKIGTNSGLTSASCLMGGGADVTLAHAHKMTMDSSGVVTAGEAVPIGDASATFNIAATAWYQQRIAAAQQAGAAGVTLSQGGWDGSGNNIVTASNGATETVSLPSFTSSGGTTWSSGVTYVYFSTPSVSLPLLTKQVSLPATSAWSATGSVSPPSSAGTITVRVGGASRTFRWSGTSWT